VPLVAGFGGAVLGGLLSFAGTVHAQRNLFAREVRRAARLIYVDLVHTASLVVWPRETRGDDRLDQSVWREHQGVIAGIDSPEPFDEIAAAYKAADVFVAMTPYVPGKMFPTAEELVAQGFPPPTPEDQFLAETIEAMRPGLRRAAVLAGLKKSEAELAHVFESPFGDGSGPDPV